MRSFVVCIPLQILGSFNEIARACGMYTFRPALGPTQPSIQWVSGFFPGVKRPGREVNHSPPSSVEVNNEWSSTSTTPVCLHGIGREHFTFYVACTGKKRNAYRILLKKPKRKEAAWKTEA